MGLFDLFTKKENVKQEVAQTPQAVVQTEQIIETEPMQNNIAEQTALKTNATVENPQPIIEQQTALNVNLNDVFQGGTTKEDEITQIISAQVNQGPEFQNTMVVEQAQTPTIPDTNPFQESTPNVAETPNIEPTTNEVQVVQPVVEQTQAPTIAPTIPDTNPFQESTPTIIETPNIEPTTNEVQVVQPVVEQTQAPTITPTIPDTNPFQESTPTIIETPNIEPTTNEVQVAEPVVEQTQTPVTEQKIEEIPAIIEPVIIEEEPQFVIIDETNEKNFNIQEEQDEKTTYEQVLMEQNSMKMKEEKTSTKFCEKCGEIVTNDSSVCPNCEEPIIE